MKKLIELKWFPPIFFLIILFAIWVGSIVVFKIPTYLLPSPLKIYKEIVQNLSLFAFNGYWTLVEAVAGYLLGGSFGFLLGSLLAYSKFFERGFLPYVVGATTIPIVAFAPLVIIYVGFGIASKIVIAAIVSFFPLTLYTLKGMQSSDLIHRDLFYVLAASRFNIFIKLQLQSALPYIFTAMKQTSTIAVIAAIIAEYIQADRGFGYLILQSSYVMDIPRMWSAVLFSCLLAMSFYGLVVLIERKFVWWHSSLKELKI